MTEFPCVAGKWACSESVNKETAVWKYESMQDIQVCEYVGMKVWKHIGTIVYKYESMQVRKYVSMWVWK